mgnify:CR=1 FL=1
MLPAGATHVDGVYGLDGRAPWTPELADAEHVTLIDVTHYGSEQAPQLAMVDWFERRGLPASDEIVDRIFAAAKAVGMRAVFVPHSTIPAAQQVPVLQGAGAPASGHTHSTAPSPAATPSAFRRAAPDA